MTGARKAARPRALPVVTVIRILGALAVIALFGIIGLALLGLEVPNSLPTVAVASLTGLAGVLAPSSGALMPGGRRAEDPRADGTPPAHRGGGEP